MYLGGTLINHILYADDICIVSLSSSGLQHLLNICSDYCERHDLTFNAKKSMCMYFSTSINKHCGLPVECRKKGHRKKGHRKNGLGKKGTGKMGTGKKGTSEKLGKKGTLQKKTDIM